MVEGRMDNVKVKLVKPLNACLSEKVCACSYMDLMMRDSGKRPLLSPQRNLKDAENIEQSSQTLTPREHMLRELVDVAMAVEQGQPRAVVSLAKQETGSQRQSRAQALQE